MDRFPKREDDDQHSIELEHMMKDEMYNNAFDDLSSIVSGGDDSESRNSNGSFRPRKGKYKRLNEEEQDDNGGDDNNNYQFQQIEVSGVIDNRAGMRDPNETRVRIGDSFVSYLPFKSAFFSYVIQGVPLKFPYMGVRAMSCKSYKLTPLPFTIGLFKKILPEEKTLSDADRKVMNGIIHNSLIGEGFFEILSKDIDPSDIDFYSNVEKQRFDSYPYLSSREELFSKLMPLYSGVADKQEYVRYFLHDQLEFINKFYPGDEHRVATIRFHDIPHLARTLRLTPEEMCCKDLHKFKWQQEDPETGHMVETPSAFDYVPIKELEVNTLDSLKIEVSRVTRGWIMCYKDVKRRYYNDKHTYMPMWSMDQVLDAYVKNDKEKQDILDYLFRRGVLIRDEQYKTLYLKRAYLHERMIARAIGKVTRNCSLHIPSNAQQARDNVLRKLEDNFPEEAASVCDEQKAVIVDSVFCKPITFITGPGGCGKTHTLKTIIRMCDPKEVFCIAFQNSNVADLRRMLPAQNIFFTNHKIILANNRTCADSPFANDAVKPDKDGLKKDKTTQLTYEKSIFEKIKVIIIDETGLQYPEILAPILYAASMYGPLCHIIFSGDHHQLSSMYAGNIIGNMLDLSAQAFNSCYMFKHNHRAHSILFDNANAIKNGECEKIVFDNKYAFHYEFSDDLPPLFHGIVKKHQLNPKSSHLVTFTNDLKRKLDECLEPYYLGKIHPTYEWRPYVFWRGCKITIKMKDTQTNVVNGEILVIDEIFDVSPLYKQKSNDDSGTLTSNGNGGGAEPIIQKFQVQNTDARLSAGVDRYLSSVTLKGDKRLIKLDAKIKKSIRRAWVTTNYSFIGKQTKAIIYVQPPYNKRETIKTVYTGFSRPEELLIYVGSLESLYKAIRTPEPKRFTTLVKFCMAEIEKVRKSDELKSDLIESIKNEF